MTLGSRIREYRKQNNMTQEYMAEQLNITRQAVSKWENDTAMPTMENLIELARLFQIPLSQLTDTSEPEKAPVVSRHPERIWQILLSITVIIALLLAFLCIVLLREKTDKYSESSVAPAELAYSVMENEILTEEIINLPDGQSVRMQLVMNKGVYYTDNWENYLPGGGIYETNYQGTYQLWMVTAENCVAQKYDLTPDFDSDTLNFPESFEIKIFDYNDDGLLDFTIGQYGSSSMQLYNLYTLDSDSIRRICSEMIPYVGDKFSIIFPVDQSEIGKGFHASLWNNAIGETEVISYRWNETEQQFLPVK